MTPPLAGQPSASMPSSAAAEEPSFSRSFLNAGSVQALQCKMSYRSRHRAPMHCSLM